MLKFLHESIKNYPHIIISYDKKYLLEISKILCKKYIMDHM